MGANHERPGYRARRQRPHQHRTGTCKIGARGVERRSCAVHAATCNRRLPDRMGGARNSQEWSVDSDRGELSLKPKTFDELRSARPRRWSGAAPKKRISPGQGLHAAPTCLVLARSGGDRGRVRLGWRRIYPLAGPLTGCPVRRVARSQP